MNYRFRIINNKNTSRFLTVFDIIGVLIPIIIWVILSFSPCKIDTDGYQILYYDNSGKNFLKIEIGFYYVMQIAKYFGFKYWAFRSIVIGTTLAIFQNAAKRLNTNVIKFWIYFLIFPLFYIAITIRFFFAFSIVLFGVSFLLSEQNRKKAFAIFAISILLATTFHTTSILFLIYYIVFFSDERRFKKIVFWIIIIEIALLFMIDRIIPLISSFVTFFRQLVIYYSFGISIIDGIQFIFTYSVILLLCILFLRFLRITINDESKTYWCVLKTNTAIINITLVSLTMLNSVLSRYFQASIVISLMFIMDKRGDGYKNSLIIRLILLAILVFLAYFFLHGRIWTAWSECFFQIRGFSDLLTRW